MTDGGVENERWGVESEEQEMGEWRVKNERWGCGEREMGEWRVKNKRWGSGE